MTQLESSAKVPGARLDQAAIRTALVFEFCPALLDDRPVAVWIQAPITFSVSR